MQESIPLNIRVMLDACRKAEKIIMKDFSGHHVIEAFDKGSGEGMCTETDVKVESILKAELSRSKPGCGFIGEECGSTEPFESDLCFIIDPIDGTSNFIRRIPFFSISIALTKINAKGSKDIIAGIIYSPVLREMYWATKGHGAYIEVGNMHTTRMRIGNKKNLERAVVLFMPNCSQDGPSLGSFMDRCRHSNISMRALGSASVSMAYVAAGKADAFFGARLKPWDIAAGMLILKEAGGITTTSNGKAANLNTPDIICASSHTHTQYVSILNKN